MFQRGIAWLGFIALWVLFVYRTTASELIAAAVASAIAVFSACAIFRAIPICFEPRLGWLAQAHRLPAMIATDLWLLFRRLVRDIAKKPSRSSFFVTPFHVIPDGCAAAAQRALAILFVSTTPNSIVLDIDNDKGQLFYHQVEPAPVPKLVRKLEE